MADPSKRCVVLGGGGHAAVLIECLRASGAAEPSAILETDRSRWGSEVLGVPVLGGDEFLPQLARQGIGAFVVGVGGIGDNEPRKRLFDLAVSHGLTPLTVRHPSAVCSASALVGSGSLLAPLSVVNARAVLGVDVIVNTAAVVEHDCVIGDHVHIATGARLSGGVRIEAGAHVGTGAIIKQGVTVQERAIVGAGAVVIRDVKAGSTVVGNPAHEPDQHLVGGPPTYRDPREVAA